MKYNLNLNIERELKEKNYSFARATINDLDDLLELYKERINWFKEKGIKQWTRYLEYHPKEEFENIIKNGFYFVMKENDKIIGGFELSSNCKYWQDDLNSAYYIYKLVTKVNYNIGGIIIKICENIAVNNNKTLLRLDCLNNNEKLNNIYENYGFKLVKTGFDDKYNYALREYKIDYIKYENE